MGRTQTNVHDLQMHLSAWVTLNRQLYPMGHRDLSSYYEHFSAWSATLTSLYQRLSIDDFTIFPGDQHLLLTFTEQSDGLNTSIKRLVEIVQHDLNALEAQTRQSFSQQLLLLAILLISACAIACAICLALSRYLILAFHRLADVAFRIGRGDYSRMEDLMVYIDDSSEIGHLTLALDEMVAQLRHRDDLRERAMTDPLTGLLNHRALQDQLAKELNQAKSGGYGLAAIFFDGDRFKSVNDTHGHAVGDEVLRCIAERARMALRHNDLLGRYGGEEFVAILANVTLDQAKQTAERIRTQIQSAPMAVEQTDGGITVTVSVGVAIYPHDALTLTELIEKADHAMYQAKHTGRNRVCLAQEQQEVALIAPPEPPNLKQKEAQPSVVGEIVA